MTDPLSPLDNVPFEWPLLELIKSTTVKGLLTVNAVTFKTPNLRNETTNPSDSPCGHGGGQVRTWSHGRPVRPLPYLSADH